MSPIAHAHDVTGLDCEKRGERGRKQRLEVLKAVALADENDDAELDEIEVLLKRDVLVDGHEGFVAGLGGDA